VLATPVVTIASPQQLTAEAAGEISCQASQTCQSRAVFRSSFVWSALLQGALARERETGSRPPAPPYLTLPYLASPCLATLSAPATKLKSRLHPTQGHCSLFRRNRSGLSDSDSTYSYPFLRSVVCLHSCTRCLTLVSATVFLQRQRGGGEMTPRHVYTLWHKKHTKNFFIITWRKVIQF